MFKWNNELRIKYLGNRDLFEYHYCKQDGAKPGTIKRLQNVITSDELRMIVLSFTYFLPHADHSSPSWDYPIENLPILKFGISNAGLRMPSSNACGILVVDSKIHFWSGDLAGSEYEIRRDDPHWIPYDRNLHLRYPNNTFDPEQVFDGNKFIYRNGFSSADIFDNFVTKRLNEIAGYHIDQGLQSLVKNYESIPAGKFVD